MGEDEGSGWSGIGKVVETANRDGCALDEFSPHDLRRTASTLLHEAGYNTDWIEKCWAHEQRNVRAVYNKAEYAEQRREMLAHGGDPAWNAEIDRVEIGFRRLAKDVVGVKLDRLTPRFGLDRRHKPLQPLLVENAGSVIEQ